ncbi:MAG: hypothetical protein AAB583_03425 [Patescibacteria group bacterium]
MLGWDKYIDTDAVRAKVRIGNKEANIEKLRDAYLKIHEQAYAFPKDMEFLFVVPWGNEPQTTDELVPPVEALDMLTTLGKGYLILDQKEIADETNGRLAHDMDNLKPETLVQFLNKDWYPKSQISTI